MSASFDLSVNYSFYAIPLAWVLTFIPGAYAKALAGKNYDIASPRKMVENVLKDDSLNKPIKNRIQRAEAAAANGNETLAMFVASIIAANHAGVPVETVNTLAATYLASRVGYIITYIFLQENRSFAPLRSIVWMAGLGSWLTLFVKAGNRL